MDISFKSTAIACLAQLESSKVRSAEYDDFGGVAEVLEDSDGDVEEPKEQIQSKAELEPKQCFKYLGFMFAVLSSLVFTLTALLVKYMERFHTFSSALWKFQGALIPVIPIIYYKMHISEKKKPVFDAIFPLTDLSKLKMFSLVMLRSILSCNSLLLHFFSLKYLGIGDALVIASSTPICVSILAKIFLGEKCGYVTGLASLMALVGVIFICRPPRLTGAESFDYDTLVGSGLAFGCMLLAAISFIVLRYIRKVHYSVTTLCYGLFGGMENFILAILFNVLEAPNGTKEWIYVCGLALLTFIGQYAIILAMKFEQAGPVSIVRTCDVIFAYTWQMLFLRTLPDLFSIIGASIVVFAVAVTGYQKMLNSLPENHATKKRFWFLLL